MQAKHSFCSIIKRGNSGCHLAEYAVGFVVCCISMKVTRYSTLSSGFLIVCVGGWPDLGHGWSRTLPEPWSSFLQRGRLLRSCIWRESTKELWKPRQLERWVPHTGWPALARRRSNTGLRTAQGAVSSCLCNAALCLLRVATEAIVLPFYATRSPLFPCAQTCIIILVL